MKEVTRNLLVGLFVLTSIVVLGILLVSFGEAPEWLGTTDWMLRITGVREIRGIGEGAPVLLNGVDIGRVARLDFEDRTRPAQGVVIWARISRQYTVPQGATAHVYGSMFGLGAGQISIMIDQDAVTTALEQDAEPAIPGEMGSMIREVLTEDFTGSFQRTVGHIGELAAATTPVAENLGKLLEARSVDQVSKPGAAELGQTANLSTMIERVDELVANVNTVLGDENVQGDLKGVAADLKDASARIRDVVELWERESQRIADDVRAGIHHTDQNLNKSIARLAGLLDHLDEAATNLAVISRRVTEGDGTLGRLVNDDRLYEAAVLSLQRLAELLGRLDRIAGTIERDGYIPLRVKTVVGPVPKKIPIGANRPDER